MGKKKAKSQTIGYAYFLGMALGLCERADRLLSFRLDGDTVANPNLTGSGNFIAKTGKQASSHGSGNSTSEVKFYDGSQGEPDVYLSSATGYELAYKNLSYLVINGFIGDNVRSAPNYSAVVERTNIDLDGKTDLQNINGDVNPAYALYYIFTRLIGLDKGVLDLGSFQKTAKTLWDEKFGISFTMSSANEAQEWVKEILRTIDGVMAINPRNGLLMLRLLRDDYEVKDLGYVNEGNIKNLVFTRKSWDDTYSQVTVKFTDRDGFKENSVTAYNGAARRTLGFKRTQSVEYMSVTNKENANKVLSRLMKKLSYPYASLKFSLSTDEFKYLAVGDVLLFSNTVLGVSNMKIRITALGSDKDDEQSIDVEAVEDVFALENFNFITKQESLYRPLSTEIGELEYYDAREACVELGEELGVLPMALAPSGFVQKITVKDGAQGDSVDISPWNLGILDTPINISSEIPPDDFGFEIREVGALWNVALSRAGWQRLKATCYIENEMIGFGVRENLGGGRWRVRVLMRGLAGSRIAAHAKGARVWFAPADANDLITLSLISPATTLYFEASNYAASSARKSLAFSHSQSSRKAYPVSNLHAVRNGGRVRLSWRNCVRLHGANYRNPDNIVAGADEGLQEGTVLISYVGKNASVSGESFECEAAAGTEFILSVQSQNGQGYASLPVKITI